MKMMEPVMEERCHALSLHATSIDETKISMMKLISDPQAMFCWSENMEDEKWRRENRRDLRQKGCLLGVIWEERKCWT